MFKVEAQALTLTIFSVICSSRRCNMSSFLAYGYTTYDRIWVTSNEETDNLYLIHKYHMSQGTCKLCCILQKVWVIIYEYDCLDIDTQSASTKFACRHSRSLKRASDLACHWCYSSMSLNHVHVLRHLTNQRNVNSSYLLPLKSVASKSRVI